MNLAPNRRALPRGLSLAALILPALLLATLLLLDYAIVDRIFPAGVSHLVTLAIGVAGVVAFSRVMLARLSELHDDLQWKSRQLQALNTAGMALSAEHAGATVLQKVADLARSVANARYAALGLFHEDGNVTEFLTSGISEEERRRIGPLPKGRGLLGVLPRERRPIRLRRIADHPASVGFPPNHPPMKSFLGVPILSRGKSLGNLYLTEKIGAEEFTSDDEEALLTLAAQAAIAIDNARLYEQVGRISVLEERHRIGMDLHDGAIQSLYGIGLMLEDAAEGLEADPAKAREDLGRAVDRLNAAIADLRGYVLGLRPVRGSDRALSESLPNLARQVGSNAMLDVRVSVDPQADRELDHNAREAVFFIAADALGNVARHARARRVELRLSRDGEGIILDVQDDGVGFEPQRATTGLGLRNMRERAFAVGGRLSLDSEPGRGTLVRFELPVRREAA